MNARSSAAAGFTGLLALLTPEESVVVLDVPTGTGAMTGVEYIPYHIGRSQAVVHKIYRDAERQSHLLLPIIPKE